VVLDNIGELMLQPFGIKPGEITLPSGSHACSTLLVLLCSLLSTLVDVANEVMIY
jgi:hypothetical protein